MRNASDFRRLARTALKGRWLRTSLILLLAALLGASAGIGTVDVEGSLDYNSTLQSVGVSLETYRTIFNVALAVMIVVSLVSIFVGALVRIGSFRVCQTVLEGEKPRVGMLFPKGVYWRAVGLKLLSSLLVYLWSLLLIIPGIIASYRYAMAEYFLMQEPSLSPFEAINRSKAYMRGNKLRMFTLELSFIGWSLLCALPSSIGLSIALLTQIPLVPAIALACICVLATVVGEVFLSAYMQVAVCAFFADVQAGWQSAYQAQQNATGNNAYNAYNPYNTYNTYNAPQDGGEADENQQPQQGQHMEDREPRAREIFFDCACSRRRIAQEGLMEEYLACGVDSSVENRWLREQAQALMLRFDRDAEVLDDLLGLIGEYALDDLADRVLQRIDRHIRQRSLPAREVLGMLGRCMALLTSGVFADREAYLHRKQEQGAEMAARLQAILEAEDPDGDWCGELGMVLMLCNSCN